MPARTIAPDTLRFLKAAVGPAGYLESAADLEPFLTDFRQLYHGRSPLVLLPASVEEVSAILKICNAERIGVVPHGGNTSYCGGATPDESGAQIVLALRHLNRVRSVAPLDYAITVEAGCVLAEVQAAAEGAGRLFPLSLGSEGSCQIGGNLSTNAGGTAVLRYGMMRDLVLGLEVVLADGRVLDELKALRKDNSGYDLRHLFLGSEGTLGIITAACLKLFPLPLEHATAFVAVGNPAAAVELLARLRATSGDTVTTFELMPRLALELVTRHISNTTDPLEHAYDWYVLVELTSARAGNAQGELLEESLASAAADGVALDAVIATSARQRQALWRLRETVPEAQRHAGAGYKHDISVPISALAEFVARAGLWLKANVPDGDMLAYGHVGDGNLHFNVQQRAGTDVQAFRRREDAVRRAIYDLVNEYRGSFSAEHGIGRLKRADLERYAGPVALGLMRTLKRALDPNGILNPGKVIDPATNPGT